MTHPYGNKSETFLFITHVSERFKGEPKMTIIQSKNSSVDVWNISQGHNTMLHRSLGAKTFN